MLIVIKSKNYNYDRFADITVVLRIYLYIALTNYKERTLFFGFKTHKKLFEV
jgi:hypothetical protein